MGAHPRVVLRPVGRMLLGLVCLAASACAGTSGWRRTEARVCESEDAALVCFAAEPDQAVELRVGDAVILPGECAQARDPETRGALVLELVRDRDTVTRRRIWVRPGRAKFIVVRANDLAISERKRCDRRGW